MCRLLHRASLGLLIALSYACSSQTTKPGDSLAAAGASGNAVGCRPSDGDSFVPGLQKPGAAGHYDFTLLNSWPAPPALDDNRFLVQVTDADGNALDGELRVTLEMPEHGHQSPKQPEIRFDDESQAFMLDPMRLFMVGLWRITFHFEAMPDGAPLADSAVFEFCID